MPSVFNHENSACWGIRRTSYNIFNEPTNFEVNTNISDASLHREEIKVENFHGSSNGYYGYHIPAWTENSDDCVMDTCNISNNENTAEHSTSNVTNGSERNNDDLWRRKRSHTKDSEDSFKRFKIEEQDVPAVNVDDNLADSRESDVNTNVEPNNRVYDEDLRMLHNKAKSNEEDSLEFVEIYFKQTHGSDLYNFMHSDEL